MKFLISLFKTAKKGDNFRAVETPNKYYNQIVQMNSLGDNIYAKLSNIVTKDPASTSGASSRSTSTRSSSAPQ